MVAGILIRHLKSKFLKFEIWENYCKALPRNRNTMEPLLNSTRREKCPLNKRERCVTELEDAWKKACSCLLNSLRQDLHSDFQTFNENSILWQSSAHGVNTHDASCCPFESRQRPGLVLCSREIEAALQRVTVGAGSTTLLPSKSPTVVLTSAFRRCRGCCYRRLNSILDDEPSYLRCAWFGYKMLWHRPLKLIS